MIYMLHSSMIYMLHRTMLGWDQCSPSSNHDSQGGECTDACHQMEVEGKVVTMMMMMMILMMMMMTLMMLMMMSRR